MSEQVYDAEAFRGSLLLAGKVRQRDIQSPERRYQKFVCWEITQHRKDGRLSRPPLCPPTATYTDSPPFCRDLLAEAGEKRSIGKLLPREAGQRRWFQCHHASASTW